MLEGTKPAFGLIYDPEVHPAGIVKYFRDGLEAAGLPERVETERGDVRYVPRPTPVPTLAGYAASINVSRQCLYSWTEKHPDFADAVDRCKAIQEAFLVEQGTMGALNPHVVQLVLKNLQGWRDKTDVDLGGSVTLKIDEQDSEA